MKNEIILWLSSLVIVFLVGYIKTLTDKDYPITGTFGIEGRKVSYKLDKQSFDKNSYKNLVISDIKGVTGKIIWFRKNERHETNYNLIDRGLEAEIPKLNPREKIKYKLLLSYADKTFQIPEKEFVTLTFWGNIPPFVRVLHFILKFGGLLMAFRSLLELFNENKNLKKFSIFTCILFIILTAMLNPLYNSYKLGAINNFIPPLTDLFTSSLLVISFIWIAGTILIFNKKYITTVTISVASATLLCFFLL